ncbi:hypothetical protein C922_05788, partial [Plasmodium inui San Antonio 1]
MGGNEEVQCDANGSCQKMISLIGCIVYWLWKDDGRLIIANTKAWSSCDRLQERIFGTGETELFKAHDGWRIKRTYQKTCQADDNFEHCQLEALSVIVSVAEAISKLCPDCPLSGLNSLFNRIKEPGPGQAIYCKPQQKGPCICVYEDRGHGKGFELISRQDSESPTESSSEGTAGRKRLRNGAGEEHDRGEASNSSQGGEGHLSDTAAGAG